MEGLFTETRLVCADCGHELEPEEIEEQEGVGLPAAMLQCLSCGVFQVREIDVDLNAELLRAAVVAGETARMLVERKPEMRPRVEAALAEARMHVEVLERAAR